MTAIDPLRIGCLTIDSPALLAPVARHCDLPFRRVVRWLGHAGLTYTDLLCPHGILKQNEQTQWLMATHPDDAPLGMQLYGRDPRLMTEAAKWAVDQGAALIDINMGCPVDKVTKTFAGSMMLCIPEETVKLAETLVRAVGDRVPVTAKTRLGWELGELTAPVLGRRLVEAGISCLTIHGRRARQRFTGHVDHEGIAQVVRAVHEAGGGRVPCIGNGDIKTPYDAARMVARTGCDGVMIARAALGAPWLIRDAGHYLAHGVIPPEPTLRTRLECYLRQVRWMAQMKDERYALARAKQVFSGYSKHCGGCKPLKHPIQFAQSVDEVADAVRRYVEDQGEMAEAVPVSWADRDAMFQTERRRAGLSVEGEPVGV